MKTAKPKVDRKIAFNRETLAILVEIAPAHAEQLNQRGAGLGWWNAVAYAFTSGQSARSAAEWVAKQPVTA